MIIVRRYFDEAEWEMVDEETARKVLAGYVLDVDLALVDIAAGCVLTTIGAEYKRSREVVAAESR